MHAAFLKPVANIGRKTRMFGREGDMSRTIQLLGGQGRGERVRAGIAGQGLITRVSGAQPKARA